MIRNSTYIFILLSLASLMLFGCGRWFLKKFQEKATIESGAIPPDFGKDTSILICIIQGKNGYDKYMKKHTINEFHGKFEFVLRNDYYLGFNKYRINNGYGYAFYSEMITTNASSIPGGGLEPGAASAQFYTQDLHTGKIYKCPFTTSFFAKGIQAYMIIFEKQRLKYLN